MNELKPKDVMMALDKLKYGGHSCHDCKYAKWSGEDRCGLNGCRIAKAALDLLRKKDAEIERLRAECDRAQAICVEMGKLNQAEIAKARAKTINEFLARAYEKTREMGDLKPFITIEDLEEIAKILKGGKL